MLLRIPRICSVRCRSEYRLQIGSRLCLVVHSRLEPAAITANMNMPIWSICRYDDAYRTPHRPTLLANPQLCGHTLAWRLICALLRSVYSCLWMLFLGKILALRSFTLICTSSPHSLSRSQIGSANHENFTVRTLDICHPTLQLFESTLLHSRRYAPI